ncbi:MAG: hypothetical protein L3K16_09220 [Thermoplasmata archaeon]|nr:hypothetical protein [Thermoplasmata archaeon]
MPLDDSQVRLIVQAWQRPDLVYDTDWLVRRLATITNQAQLGMTVQEALRDAVNDGFLYIDQIRMLNAFSGYRAFLGLTASGQAYWRTVFPNAEA